ncbi:hypothetical protein AWC38_SpisGene22525 [Stylophora pistillata]|uniref:Beta/gamma crystallin 'Greek key' domain-containing protein n=1 Tax=Stylophora pistillata TaxID=50429 RepID=A0A2B4R9B2_STYPI|nr:hypothetical protein AWC38_SpisGene22525 [Stylophora pistillata]
MTDAKIVKLYEATEYKGKEATLTAASPDLATVPINLPKGASSVKVGSQQSSWRVFTEINFEGASAILSPGRDYGNLEDIGLASPIKSMRVP